MPFFALFQSHPCNRITSLSRGFLADMSNSYGTYLRCFPSNFMLFCNCRSTPAHFLWKGGEASERHFQLLTVRRSRCRSWRHLQVAWRTVPQRQALTPRQTGSPSVLAVPGGFLLFNCETNEPFQLLWFHYTRLRKIVKSLSVSFDCTDKKW